MELQFVLCLLVFFCSVQFNLAQNGDVNKLKKQVNREKSSLVEINSNVEKIKSALQSSLDTELIKQFDTSLRLLNDNLRLAHNLLRKKLYAAREKGLNLHNSSSCIHIAKAHLLSVNATAEIRFLKCREEANGKLKEPLTALDKLHSHGKHLLSHVDDALAKCTGNTALNCMKSYLQNIHNSVQNYEDNVKSAKIAAQKELSNIIKSASKCYNDAVGDARVEILNSRAITSSCARYRKKK